MPSCAGVAPPPSRGWRPWLGNRPAPAMTGSVPGVIADATAPSTWASPGNVLLVSVLFTGLWHWVAELTATRNLGLLNVIPMAGGCARSSASSSWIYGPMAGTEPVTGFPLLWRLHRVTTPMPPWTSPPRTGFTPGNPTLGTFAVAPDSRIGNRFQDLVVYETVLQVGVQWHHANIRLSETGNAGPVGGWSHLTPSSPSFPERPQTDSNYASVLPSGTGCFSLKFQAHPETVRIGQDGLDAPEQ